MSGILLALLALQPLPAAGEDPAREAAARLEAGMALTASRALARHLSTGAEPTPSLLLLAARAHAEARAWPTVRRLLAGRSWLDEREHGAGRALLARALLALDSPAAALPHYERWLAAWGGGTGAGGGVPATLASPGPPPAEVRVGAAGALLRLDRPGAAADVLEEAAAAHPGIARWLRLSALQARAASGDTAGARSLAERLLADPVIPADSVRRELALAAFRAADPERGLAEAEALGARARAALAARWTAPARLARRDSAGAAEDLRLALDLPGATAEAGRLLLSLDTSSAALRAVAESDVRDGRSGRAVGLLERLAVRAPPAERPDLALRIAGARFAAGAYREAAEELAPWLGGSAGIEVAPETLGEMWFLAGRAHYRRGLRGRAVEAWREALRHPGPNAAYAAYLVADVAHDAGDLAAARSGYEATLARFPASGFAGTALFRLGLLDLLEGAPAAAAARFSDYRRRFAGGNWHRASQYWEARAGETAGDAARARRLYAELAADPTGYYGIRAAARAGLDPWRGEARGAAPVPRGAPAAPGAGTAVDAELVRRMSLLRSLGWRERALAELRAGRRERARTAGERLRLAELLNAEGWTWQGASLAREAHSLSGGRWSDRLLRAAYPLPYRAALETAAGRHGVDPALVAGLAHRESRFDPDAVSSAGAVGLMQVLPRTGREIAGREGLTEFRSEQLHVPEVNLALGTRYLADLLRRHGTGTAALAAYNAGPHRLRRWAELPEFEAGEEMFSERIPFSETRQYVKAVLAAADVYRRLYWPPAAPAGEAASPGVDASGGGG